MKKLMTICAAALAFAVMAVDTDCGALITTGNIADSAKVENLTGANAGKATITINNNAGTANSVTVYNASTMDTALSGYVPTSRKVAGMALTGDITLNSLSIVGASTTTYNGSAAASVNQSTLTEAAKTSGGTSGKTLTLAVASTSRSLGEYYISIGSDGKPHLMLRQ